LQIRGGFGTLAPAGTLLLSSGWWLYFVLRG